MKRYITLFLAIFMIAAISGCNSVSELLPESTGTESGETEGIEEEALKIGFLFPSDSNAPDTVSREEGIEKMLYQTGLSSSQVIIEESVTEDTYLEKIDSLAQQGCDIIFSSKAGYESMTLEAAEKYPEIQFCQEDGKKAKKSGLSNMHNYYSKIYEAYYVSGVAAGMKLNHLLDRGKISSESCNIGFVASRESAENISCMTAFYLGVRQVCSQADVLIRYVGTSGNYDDDAECARQLIAAGASLICQRTFTTGAATVCAESDIPVVGNEVNIIDKAPNEALTSAVTDWSVYYTLAVQAVMNGEEIATDWCGGYAEGAVSVSQLNDENVAEGTAKKLAEVESGLRKGTVKVFDTTKFTIDGESLEDLVAAGGEYKKYKKYVSDGEFHENLKRSAPSFCWLIDGVYECTGDYLGEDEDTEEETTEEETTEESSDDGDVSESAVSEEEETSEEDEDASDEEETEDEEDASDDEETDE